MRNWREPRGANITFVLGHVRAFPGECTSGNEPPKFVVFGCGSVTALAVEVDHFSVSVFGASTVIPNVFERYVFCGSFVGTQELDWVRSCVEREVIVHRIEIEGNPNAVDINRLMDWKEFVELFLD